MKEVIDKLLFTTPFCARCPGVKKKLEANGYEFTQVNAIQNQNMVQMYGVKGVPSLVITFDDESWKLVSTEELGEMIGGL
jgi:glutaredoxin